MAEFEYRKKAEAPPEEDRRPGCMTGVALFLFFAAGVWVILAFGEYEDLGDWYTFHLFVQGVIAAVAAYGLWRMRKWGAYLLIALAVAIHILYANTGFLNIETFVIYTGMIITTVYFFHRLK